MHIGAKMVDFGIPSAHSWIQIGVQNRPSGAKGLQKSCVGPSLEVFWDELASKMHPESLLGTILVDLAWICHHFLMDFG